MAQLAEQQMVDMAAEAAQGLLSTPGDPTHVATICKLHVSPSAQRF